VMLWVQAFSHARDDLPKNPEKLLCCVCFQVFSVFFLENVTNWIPNSELELNSLLNSRTLHTEDSARISNDSDDDDERVLLKPQQLRTAPALLRRSRTLSDFVAKPRKHTNWNYARRTSRGQHA